MSISKDKTVDSDEIKVQTVAIGKAAQLYKLIKGKSKSAAITAAILLLARSKRFREVFFSDIDKVKEILYNGNEVELKDESGTDVKIEREDGWS